MTDQTSITVEREVPASAAELFEVLSNPHRHIELDSSGFVRGLDRGDRIEKVGQQFTMNMTGEHMGGDYQTDNIISAFDENKMIGWKTAPAGTEPPGWEWLWELTSTGSDTTKVTLTYDWSNVTDQDLLDEVGFPLVSEEEMAVSLGKLAAAASAT